MLRNMLLYGKLKRASKLDDEGKLKSKKHEKKTLSLALVLIHQDPLMESGWTAKGLIRFEDSCTERMFRGLLSSTKKGRPEEQRKAAVILLGSSKNPDAESYLLDVVNDDMASKELRRLAKRSLMKIGITDLKKKDPMNQRQMVKPIEQEA